MGQIEQVFLQVARRIQLRKVRGNTVPRREEVQRPEVGTSELGRLEEPKELKAILLQFSRPEV